MATENIEDKIEKTEEKINKYVQWHNDHEDPICMVPYLAGGASIGMIGSIISSSPPLESYPDYMFSGGILGIFLGAAGYLAIDRCFLDILYSLKIRINQKRLNNFRKIREK